MTKPISTPVPSRSALLKSWDAARRDADRTGAIILNAASFAGYALALGGTVAGARTLVPAADGSVYYARVLACLASVEQEEHLAGGGDLALLARAAGL